MRPIATLAAAAAMLAAAGLSGAHAAPVPAAPAPSAVERAPEAPDWLAAPSFEDLARAYPRAALEKGVSGQTEIRCTVKTDGGLADCTLVGETPADMGFGRASLSLAGQFRMKPEAVAALPGTPPAVKIPIRWAIIASPDWLGLPSGDDLASLFPDRAKEENRSGRAEINCRVKADGTLDACVLLSETPEGFGFGRATIRAARFFRMSPMTVDGKPVEGGVVRIPMVWQLSAASPILTVGDNAVLITILEHGAKPSDPELVFKCPSAEDPARRCQGHRVVWAERPSNADVRAATAGRRLGDAATRINCKADGDGRLTDCGAVSPGTTPDQEAAMRALVAGLKASGAADHAPLTAGRIIIQFDWGALRQAAAPGR
jgi:TonB family protein